MGDQRPGSASSPPIPILRHKNPGAASVFKPGALLREGRRQRGIPDGPIPELCLLDPDGDLVRHLTKRHIATRCSTWACYHTDLYEFSRDGMRFGVVGRAVGASFAVLIAEQMFQSGCRLLISVTSSGQLKPVGPTPYFVLTDRALRDEGTSYHYLPPSEFIEIDRALLDAVAEPLSRIAVPVHRGATWTTDAPFRETAEAVEAHRAAGLLAVEMEAAALYAFARARAKPVICFAHVTNQMAVNEGDFEKGEADGATATLTVVAAVARAWLAAHPTGSRD